MLLKTREYSGFRWLLSLDWITFDYSFPVLNWWHTGYIEFDVHPELNLWDNMLM